METRLALPSMASVTFSSLMPRSSLITWPLVSTPMSSSMALRRSPKPGALTAATFRPPRSLLTTSVASASPSISSATISSGLPVCTIGLEHGQQRLQARQLLLVDEDVGLLQLHRHLLGIGDEVGRKVAAIELHAFDDIELGIEALGFLDRDHALVADLLHGLGDHVADGLLAVSGHGADLGDLGRVLDLLRLLLDLLDDLGDGFLDAALQIHRVHAGRDRLHALAQDGMGQNRGSGGAVTGHVIGLLGDFAHHLRAHVLELVLELDLLGDGDAVLGRCAERRRTCR